MAHVRAWNGPAGPAVVPHQAWLPPAVLPHGYPPHLPYAPPVAAWPPSVLTTSQPRIIPPNPHYPIHAPIPALLSQPQMAQISQPQPSHAPPTNPTPSTTATAVSQQQSQNEALEQKRKERDKRERERKERERQQKIEMEKREQKQRLQQQQLLLAKAQPKTPNLLRTPTEFLCKMQFRNNLPDIPFDPKLLVLPMDPMRYTKCIIGSTLENTYKHSIFTEPDLGIPINLIDTNIYKIPSGDKQLDPEDQALVDANVASTPKKASGMPTSEKPRVRPSVPWLIKTKYLCNEEDLPQFKAKGVESAPSNYKLQRAGAQAHDVEADSIEGQIRAVEDTFEAAKRVPVHPTNPALRPVEILPIFPDFTLWPNTYTEVVFDSDPITTLSHERRGAMEEEDKQYLRSNAIVRGIRGQPLVAFITPTGTRKRGREELTEEDEEYEEVSAFHFDVAKDADLKDNYFFVFTPEAVYYNELATRVKLRKVQAKEEKAQLLSIPRPVSVHVACEAIEDEKTKMERDERYMELLQPASTEEAADM